MKGNRGSNGPPGRRGSNDGPPDNPHRKDPDPERDHNSGGPPPDRVLLVDASALITLTAVDGLSLLDRIAGDIVVPHAVAAEVTEDPAARALADGIDDGWIRRERADETSEDQLLTAGAHLGVDDPGDDYSGDVALLALAIETEDAVVVTDDKPLRRTCKALSIPLSGSIGVLIRAVERGDLDADDGKSKLLAVDEVGARLSATLLRRAERLIDEAAER